jgi:hypothetical protein
LKKLHVAVSHLAVTDKMLSVNRGFFDPSVSEEIMSRASGKFSAALQSSCSQCLPLVFSKWRLVYFIDAEWLVHQRRIYYFLLLRFCVKNNGQMILFEQNRKNFI